MPAFAQFVAVYVRGSPFIKSLRRSRLLTRSVRTREPSTPSKDVSTGSNPPPRRNNYYELTDTMLLETRATIPDDTAEMDNPNRAVLGVG